MIDAIRASGASTFRRRIAATLMAASIVQTTISWRGPGSFFMLFTRRCRWVHF
ncbi:MULTISPECIES: hypothetical protein [unclassified Burkholderia]|uniref:hypothetical protein n=1 Tax=unclassified Burkholderia TaxID=2613784 RepID=UPI001623E38B|nr:MULTISPECIES: hypothetical protein [unclassified Burkholderia]